VITLQQKEVFRQPERRVIMQAPRKYKLYTYERLTQSKLDTQKIVAIAITVTTGSIPNAGTDANVRLLIGANRFDMDTFGYNDFERGVIPIPITLRQI
jgi:hypothetical protein